MYKGILYISMLEKEIESNLELLFTNTNISEFSMKYFFDEMIYKANCNLGTKFKIKDIDYQYEYDDFYTDMGYSFRLEIAELNNVNLEMLAKFLERKYKLCTYIDYEEDDEFEYEEENPFRVEVQKDYEEKRGKNRRVFVLLGECG